MERLIVNPYEVYGFAEHFTGVSKVLLAKIKQEGWKEIPLIPCFRVPVDIPQREHEYMLFDGNHRLLVARVLNELVPIALYTPEEEINAIQDCLAHARAVTDPLRYKRTIYLYHTRKEREAREHVHSYKLLKILSNEYKAPTPQPAIPPIAVRTS